MSAHPARYRWLLLPAVLLLASAIVAACDDDDEDGTPSPGEETPTATAPGGAATPAAGQPTPAPGAGGEEYEAALALLLEEDGEVGSEAPDDLLSQWNIDVTPDGAGLPEGSGTAAEGAEIYAAECAACHGPDGEGGIGPRLVSDEPGPWEPGGQVTIGSWWPYATTVYDYIRRAMPFFEPGTLSDDEAYALTAFLLSKNEIIEADEEMNQDTLPQVEMPARDLYHECWPDLCYDAYGRDGEDGGATATPEGESPTPEGESPTPAGASPTP